MTHLAERSNRRWLGGVALAAAALLALGGIGARLFLHVDARPSATLEVLIARGSATQVQGEAHAPVPEKQNTHLAAAGDLETGPASSAKVRTAEGLELELGSQTRVGLSELTPRASQVKLVRGNLRCNVPHRTAAHAFQVVTPDTTVVDLGTIFTVEVGDNHATRVTVEEGEVLIRHGALETHLHAPNTWASAPPAVEPFPALAPDLPASAPLPSPSQSNVPNALPAPNAKSAHPPAAGGTLAEEAQLLRQGLAAERQGRSADAAGTFRQLLAKYPHSPLVPDARSALGRVEAGSGR